MSCFKDYHSYMHEIYRSLDQLERMLYDFIFSRKETSLKNYYLLKSRTGGFMLQVFLSYCNFDKQFLGG